MSGIDFLFMRASKTPMKPTSDKVEVRELQGPYGPLRIMETRIQEVWALQQLRAADWRLQDGRSLRVEHPGSLNRGGGPDFHNAVLQIGGERRVGDVELHLYREDWWRHGHHVDPAYSRVLLHVVLFAGGMDAEVRTHGGESPAEWVLGPWLLEDVEGLSGGEPGLFGELVPELCEWADSTEPECKVAALLVGADRRFEAKEAMAGALLRGRSWEDAARHLLLYYLGFPLNRRAFFALAGRLQAADWLDPQLPSRLRADPSIPIVWTKGRPANHASTRLRQFQQLCLRRPDWHVRMASPPVTTPAFDIPDLAPLATRAWRRSAIHRTLRHWWQDEVLGHCLPQTTTARLWVDVALPMLAAGSNLSRELAFREWFHAEPGPFPEANFRILRKLALQRSDLQAVANGWMQGLVWQEDQLRLQRFMRPGA